MLPLTLTRNLARKARLAGLLYIVIISWLVSAPRAAMGMAVVRAHRPMFSR